MALNTRQKDFDIIDALYDFASELPSDKLITSRFEGRAPSILPKFHGRHPDHAMPRAVMLARRAIEVAVIQARDEMQKSIARNISEFEKINAAARKAEDALHELIQALDPNAKTGDYLKLPLATLSAGLVEGLGSSAEGIHLRFLQIEEEATLLWRSRALAKSIKEQSARKGARLSLARKNDPKPEERAFVRPLAEMWTYLMGYRPGKSEIFEKNPFLQFVVASWEMAFPFDPEQRIFKGALRSSLNSLDDVTVKGLIWTGPDWK